MKQAAYILTFILFALTSCSTDNKSSSDDTTAEDEQQDSSATSFENYLKTLDQIPLPLSHNPQDNYQHFQRTTTRMLLKNINMFGQVHLWAFYTTTVKR